MTSAEDGKRAACRGLTVWEQEANKKENKQKEATGHVKVCGEGLVCQHILTGGGEQR